MDFLVSHWAKPDQSPGDRLENAYLAMARNWPLWQQRLDEALGEITQCIAESAAVERASIWQIEGSGEARKLVCLDLYRRSAADHSAGVRLAASRYPSYFDALDQGRIIDAHDAGNDIRTREFRQSYLRPLGIGAMLDATLRRAGATRGVVCIEHVGGPRLWSEQEQTFLLAVADLVSQLLLHDELRDRSQHLQLLNDLAARLHGTTDVERIAHHATHALLQFSEAPSVAFLEFTGEDCRLRAIRSCGPGQGHSDTEQPIDFLDGLAETVLAERSIILFSDPPRDLAAGHEMPTQLLARGYRSGLAIPLIQEQQTLGLIFLWFRSSHRPSARELETFRTFGKTVSLSMANALHVTTLTHQASHDPLTGLPNRQALHDYCEAALPKARARNEQTVLCLLDLNRFKEINDTLGHQVGDKALIHVAKCLRKPVGECRTTAYRLGGDEFAILIEDLPPHGGYLEAAERLLSAIRKPFELGGIRLEVGGSLGLALFPDHGSDSHELLRCADIAMYCAKADVDPLRVYDDLCDVHTPERLLLMQDLSEAVRGNQLLLHYQPKINLRSGRVGGCEALLRWQHPRRGLIPPEQFIPLAEMGDLIGPLTDRVLEEALSTLRGWHTRGIPLEMSVNLSTRNLVDRQCPQRLSELLRQYPVAPSSLELEITESALMNSPELALEQARRFKDLGIQLSLDDFGTGYSSLAHLKQLQPHVLKIDRAFIRDLLGNETDMIIVRSTIAMAQGLGLTVLAEGVEDQATMDALRDLGCDQAQGFHIGVPMTETEFLAWLKQNHPNQS